MIKPVLRLKKRNGHGRLVSTFLTCTFCLLLLLPAAVFGQTYSIFPSTTPSYTAGNDGTAIETGVKFRVTQAGTISAIRYYKVSGITGTRTAHLWSSTGTLLATATFTGETASGWQQVSFSSPVSIQSGVTYVASVHSTSGAYTYTTNYFTNAVINGLVKALANGEDGTNGVYSYSASAAFPTSSYQSANYWIDVVFTGAGAVGNWNLSGNATTSPVANFLGTTDNQPLVIKSNNQELVRISADPAQPSLLIKPSTGQTANSFEFRDGAGSPLVKMKTPDGSTYGQSTLTIDGGNKTNQPAFTISNIGSGFSGLAMNGNTGGSVILENFNLSPKWRYVNKHAVWDVQNNAFDAASPQSYLFMHSSQPATNVLMTLQGQASQTGDMLKIKDGSGTDIFRVLAAGGGYFAGNVGIGTTSINDAAYKLFVDGGIRARKVKVDQASWADFVFDDNYRLPTLTEVEKFISLNKHLPDVPSAAEVEKEGLNLGDNQAVLLRKIEELTLYAIEQNKKIEKQQEQIDQLLKLLKK